MFDVRETRDRRLLLGVCASLLALCAFNRAFAEVQDCSVARESIEAASKIRGLAVKKAVPCFVHNQDQVRQYLLSAITEKIPPEKLKNEELVGKALGLLPQNFNYKEEIVNLYLSQLGGYYDPEKKHFIMAGWLPELMQPTIAVHEMTHALQDQYFDLKQFIDDKIYFTDELLARSALVEGDATAVMLDYQRAQVGGEPVAQSESVDSFIVQSILSLSLTSGASAAPEALKMILVFPYASGLRFVHSQLRTIGYKGLDKMFSNPPRSTEEILHPELYGRETSSFRKIDDREFSDYLKLPESRIVYSDVLGEFVISTLLAAAQGDKSRATHAAGGWGGDRVVVIDQGGRSQVVWKTLWDTEKDASEFFEMYRDARITKSGGIIEQAHDKFKVELIPWRVTGSRQGSSVTIHVISISEHTPKS